MKKKVVALLMGAVLAFSLTACGNEDTPASASSASESSAEESKQESVSEESTEQPTVPEETVVIRYGTHWVNELDPNHVDDVTGEYTMSEANRQAALQALEKVKQELNVEFEFIQYSGDVRNDLMTSVLAGKPATLRISGAARKEPYWRRTCCSSWMTMQTSSRMRNPHGCSMTSCTDIIIC